MKKTRFVMGKNCIEEIVRLAPERILVLYTSHKKLKPPFSEISQVRSVSKEVLYQKCGSESHQGYVALVQERPALALRDIISESDEREALILILDAIEDPQNFGALLRSAECFGVDAVIYSRNRGVGVTPAVSKVSVGASEIVPLVEVANLHESLLTLQKAGFTCYAAENEAHAKPYHLVEYPKKTALIVGSEGKGVQKLLKQKADGCVMVPLKGRINSLNVAQATAVLLAHIQR